VSQASVTQQVSAQQIDQLSINTIRTLSIDAVQQANSGHPGAPMGLAPVVYQLWQRYLKYDPANPVWPNRDRFVLSAGHASMLLYSTLHLAGVRALNEKGEVLDAAAVPMEEIKRFRQIDSRTAGHPESHLTSGVETTTRSVAPITAVRTPSECTRQLRLSIARLRPTVALLFRSWGSISQMASQPPMSDHRKRPTTTATFDDRSMTA